MAITALPVPPARNDPTNFAVRADAFLAALPTFTTEANALQVDVNNKQTLAAASQAAAAASEAAAASTSGVTIWVSGTTYALGDNRFDPVDFKTYRRSVAGAGTTRPGLDGTNWVLLTSLGDMTLSSTQTVTGVKTFSQTIVGTIQNANVAAALSDGTVLVPTGNVSFTARATAPSGWIKANGAAIDRTTYSALFTAIGTTFGGGNGSTTFNVPDLRGEFIRGHDDGRGIDSGRVYGSAQGDELKSHNHNPPAGVDGWVGTQFTGDGSIDGSRVTGTGERNPAYSATANTGGVETRPRNIALLAIIKF